MGRYTSFIINMRDGKEEIGHYEVAIGIDREKIIFSEPGSALAGKIDFESIPKVEFYRRWRNMSGKQHGRFLILPPNAATAVTIATILKDMPHYFNGEAKNQADSESPTFKY